MHVENITVVFGVGMSIGSVPPSKDHSCIKGVTFKNINFSYPLKAIYIKTNPGTGSGEVSNILYENIVMDTPIWWGIYIGPQ
jgi:polygalacturonase